MTDLTPRRLPYRTLRWPVVVTELQDKSRNAGFDEPLYIVGGAVRDAFLHRPVKDLDLATSGNAIRSARKMANLLNGDIYVLDGERDVARVLWQTDDRQFTIDIAHFRGDDLLADLMGRDFTINAMAVELHGDLNQIIDPLNGGQDAQQKIMRQCTDQSFEDDPLRVLRAIRQSVQLSLRIEPTTMKAIRQHAPHVMATSSERVRDEFMAMLALDRPTRALRVADAIGVLGLILPEIMRLKSMALPPPHIFDAWKHTLETVGHLRRIIDTISYNRTDSTAANFDMGMLAMQFDRYRKRLNAHLERTWPAERSHDAVLMLGALLHEAGREVAPTGTESAAATITVTCAERLRLSNPEKKILNRMIAHYTQMQLLDVEQPLALHRYWYSLNEHGLDALLLGLADYLATYGNLLNQDDWLVQVERAVTMLVAYFDQQETVVSPPMPVDGTTLMNRLNLDPGPIVGDLLTHIREGLVTQAITDYDEALAAARTYLETD